MYANALSEFLNEVSTTYQSIRDNEKQTLIHSVSSCCMSVLIVICCNTKIICGSDVR